jgi:cysteine desulfurase
MKIYLDNAATTPTNKEVIRAMNPYWNKNFGNPSSIHSLGVSAKVAIQKSKKVLADFLNAHDREIVFTSGGTESNNFAIFGLINALRKEGKKYSDMHFITTDIEHSSISECFKELESRGAKVDYMKVDEFGIINSKDLRNLIRIETILISICYANSEIGVIQPIRNIIKEIRHFKKENRCKTPYLHIDASQAALYLNMNVEELGVDLVTLDAQKMYGPKGIGALYIRDDVSMDPIIFGGGQEGGKRSGTENVPLVVGFAKTIELANKNREKENKRLTIIRDYFFQEIVKIIPEVLINGHRKERLPNNINISIPGYDGEMLVLRFDEKGIICSSSSACASGNGESEVVKKISNDIERAKSTLRFTMGKDTKFSDINKLLNTIKKICQN